MRGSEETHMLLNATVRNIVPSSLAAKVRLAVTLRFLAGGMVNDLSMIYCISMSEIYTSIWRTIDAINEALPVEFPINDPEKLELLEREFRGRSHVADWVGEIGAVDGCHFGMHNPGKAVRNPARYHVSRKSCSAMLVTAVCDIHRRFTFWDFNVEPTTHDSQAWALSELGLKIANGELDSRYFINGDSAYVLGPQMVVPYGKPAYTNFDYVQSSNRICIECAFGVRSTQALINVANHKSLTV